MIAAQPIQWGAWLQREPVPVDELQPGNTAACKQWRAGIYDRAARGARMLEAGYMRVARMAGYVAANQRLNRAAGGLKRFDLDLTADDQALRDWCDNKARLAKLKKERWGDVAAYEWALTELQRYQLPEPESYQGELFGKVERVACRAWWVRQVRKAQLRAIDQTARDLRLVRKGGQIYASTEAVRLVGDQKRRNRALLETMEATNQHGDTFTLAELADKSTSKPELRRNELMARISGFEEIAKNSGHDALFVTVTCPSRFHIFSGNRENPNHSGETVRDAQAYLVNVWARIRSKLARDGLRVYGFRVTEPHHDGCPHQHFLLFAEPAQVRAIKKVFRRWALMDSPNEPGAWRSRCKVVQIDPAKGSAAGYIAKYISKSIDGAHCGQDLFGTESGEAAGRICAWASTYGVRQFQQIGGAGVGVWRELRRLRDEVSGALESLRSVADAGDWAAYQLLMGGVFCRRIDRPCQPAKEFTLNVETGEVSLNRYREPVAGRVVGVVFRGVVYITRVFEWVISRAKGAGGGAGAARSVAPLDLCQ